jgi:hypothetical protein
VITARLAAIRARHEVLLGRDTCVLQCTQYFPRVAEMLLLLACLLLLLLLLLPSLLLLLLLLLLSLLLQLMLLLAVCHLCADAGRCSRFVQRSVARAVWCTWHSIGSHVHGGGVKSHVPVTMGHTCRLYWNKWTEVEDTAHNLFRAVQCVNCFYDLTLLQSSTHALTHSRSHAVTRSCTVTDPSCFCEVSL